MQRYIARRLLLACISLIGVSIIIFGIVRMLPGDVIIAMVAESGNVRPSDVEKLKREMGLDQPIHIQYVNWVGRLASFDLGHSIYTNEAIGESLKKALPVTVELALMALIISQLLAIPIGLISAIRQDTAGDYLGRLLAITGLSIPDFWLGTVVVTFLAIWFHWIPKLGYVTPWENPLGNIEQLMLPAAIMGFRLSAVTMRMMRSTMLEVLREDYIRTAWAKGLRERVVIARHAVKNAFIPVVTIIGGQISGLLGGAVIMETIFALPGMGRLTLDAIIYRDYPLIQTNVMLIGVWIVGMNLLVDLTYAWFDPRIRYQ